MSDYRTQEVMIEHILGNPAAQANMNNDAFDHTLAGQTLVPGLNYPDYTSEHAHSHAVAAHDHGLLINQSGTVVTNIGIGSSWEPSGGSDTEYLKEGFDWVAPEDVPEVLRKWVGSGDHGVGIYDISWSNDWEVSDRSNQIVFHPLEPKIKPHRRILNAEFGVDVEGEAVVTILPGGGVIMKEGVAADEAARNFWVAVAKFSPDIIYGQAKKLEDAVREAIDLCECEGKCEKCILLAANLPSEAPELKLVANKYHQLYNVNFIHNEPPEAGRVVFTRDVQRATEDTHE